MIGLLVILVYDILVLKDLRSPKDFWWIFGLIDRVMADFSFVRAFVVVLWCCGALVLWYCCADC